MTPTEQDKELRENVNKLLDFFTEPDQGVKYLKDLENNLMELIKAYGNEVEQEAYKKGHADGVVEYAKAHNETLKNMQKEGL